MVMSAQEFAEKHSPLRIVVRYIDGVPLGLVEHPWSMAHHASWVRLFWSGDVHSNMGTSHTLNAIDWAASNAEPGDITLDPLAADCPVRVDVEAQMAATSTYDRRNAPFVVTNPRALRMLSLTPCSTDGDLVDAISDASDSVGNDPARSAGLVYDRSGHHERRDGLALAAGDRALDLLAEALGETVTAQEYAKAATAWGRKRWDYGEIAWVPELQPGPA